MPLQTYNPVGDVDINQLLGKINNSNNSNTCHEEKTRIFWDSSWGPRWGMNQVWVIGLSLQIWHLNWDKDEDELARKMGRALQAEEAALEHEWLWAGHLLLFGEQIAEGDKTSQLRNSGDWKGRNPDLNVSLGVTMMPSLRIFKCSNFSKTWC